MTFDKPGILRLFALLIFSLVMVAGAVAQDDTVVSLQGAGNLGTPQFQSLADVLRSTGIWEYQNANFDGRGVRVGVIDTAFGGLNDLQSSLRDPITILPEHNMDDYSNANSDHGTNVLQIINTVAPRAKLYACRYINYEGFQRCIDWMINVGVQIINHSAGVPALPLDGSNIWAQQVSRASRSNILWVNAAGNFAGGYLEDIFTDQNAGGNGYHEFRGGELREEIIFEDIQHYEGNIYLSWENAVESFDNDGQFVIEIINLVGTVIAESTPIQTQIAKGFNPIQRVHLVTDGPFAIRIRYVSGNKIAVRLVLFVEFVDIPTGKSQSTTIAPADSPDSLTVGAQQGTLVATYSSRGPVREDSISPLIVAPGELILTRNGEEIQFAGTSAAAPVVAGVAAIRLQQSPGSDHDDLWQWLITEATQDDIFTPGPDTSYGYGRLSLPPLIGASGTPIPDVQEVNCTITVSGNTRLRGGPGTNYPQVGLLSLGEPADVYGRHNANDGFVWYFLGEGAWVRANLGSVEGNCLEVPVVDSQGNPGTFVEESCPGAPPQRLRVGDTARQALENDPVRIQNEPGGGTTLLLLYPGAEVVIIGGPYCQAINGQPATWWQVDRGNGWIAEGVGQSYFLEPASPG